jgi:hypothetical protein
MSRLGEEVMQLSERMAKTDYLLGEVLATLLIPGNMNFIAPQLREWAEKWHKQWEGIREPQTRQE